ncbi:hypothetical protein [Budvicia aquatica]|uniref:hypothetical protein n=1 Tax=Budvicia aquatica TaxID=82979 RepID=UPI00208046AA|nr:hypothetical protein [Budvicia aquatica]GKX52417.1 hypothetical protein SOASR029_27260 [Budvicia aquatica]
MNTFDKLNTLLSVTEGEYYDNDYFLDAEIQIALLSEADLPLLLTAWQSQNTQWWDRFTQSSAHIQQPVLRSLLAGAITTRYKIKQILSLMTHLPAQADRSELSQSLVNYSAALWHAEPKLHLQIQLSTWSCGLSARLLEKLGFNSWKEAGL